MSGCAPIVISTTLSARIVHSEAYLAEPFHVGTHFPVTLTRPKSGGHMANDRLATYLNDHLAGAVAALDLLGRLEAAQAGTPAASELAELRAEIAADRQALATLMSRLNVDESRSRKALAWLTERATHFKLRLDDSPDGALGRLEALDALALGIEGKHALWQALAVVADGAPGLEGVDYQALTQRADDQRRRVEQMRLEAARTALVGVS